jgi:hypothetical protein
MLRYRMSGVMALVMVGLCSLAVAQNKTIPPGSKVFIAPMGGFEADLKAALESKKVPLTVVDQRDQADYELTGTSDSQKASAAKKILLGSWHSREEASISIADVKSGTVVYAYSYHNDNSAHGKKSSAESCAKHLKENIK